MVIPLISMQQSCLLCISTVLESDNHYSEMMNLHDKYGKKVFNTITITLVCDECMKTDNPTACTHKLSEAPKWISSEKVETIKALMEKNQAMLLRESFGVSADSNTRAFYNSDIEAFFDTKVSKIPSNLFDEMGNARNNHIVISVDPSGGGKSQFAIFSLMQLHHGPVVVSGGNHGSYIPSVSFSHIVLMSVQETTNRSGLEQLLLKYMGNKNGITLKTRSLIICASACVQCLTQNL